MDTGTSAMDTAQWVAVAAAMGWASGLRLYAVLFLTGAAGYLGWVPLPSGLSLLENPWMLGASGLMFVVEFFADKIPVLDTVWDAVHTFLRIPAGAALAAGAMGLDSATLTTMVALLGGSLAASAHLAKATTRAAVNTSPEPFSNVGLSLVDDAVAPGLLALAWTHPEWALGAVAVLLVLSVILTVVLWRFLRRLIRTLRQTVWGAPVAVSAPGVEGP